MPVNYNDYIVFDFETGNKDGAIAPVLQIGAVVLQGNNLEMKPDKFMSFCKPEADEMQYVQDEALAINNIKREDIDGFPLISEVFKSFAAWIEKYNYRKNSFDSPIPAGYNIRGYDMPIFQRLCTRYGFVDKNGKQNLLNTFKFMDCMDLVFPWFDGNKNVANYRLDTIRAYMGLTSEGAHSALVDAEHTALIIQRFMRFQRKLAQKDKFKDAFANAE